MDWNEVLRTVSTDEKEMKLNSALQQALDTFLPNQTYRVKDDEKPWITNGLRELVKKKKIYKQHGFKSEKWKKLNKAIEKSLFCKKEAFYKNQVQSLKGAIRKNWHRRMKVLMNTEPTKRWKIQDLWPGQSDQDIAKNSPL